MGGNLFSMLTAYSKLPDEEIAQIHPDHTQASIISLLERCRALGLRRTLGDVRPTSQSFPKNIGKCLFPAADSFGRRWRETSCGTLSDSFGTEGVCPALAGAGALRGESRSATSRRLPAELVRGLGRFQYFRDGMCVVHHMFGDQVVSKVSGESALATTIAMAVRRLRKRFQLCWLSNSFL